MLSTYRTGLILIKKNSGEFWRQEDTHIVSTRAIILDDGPFIVQCIWLVVHNVNIAVCT